MKRFMLVLCLALAIGGCAVNREYIAADKATLDAIAPEYLKYVDADPDMPQDQKDRRHRTVETWKLRIAKGNQ